MTSSRRRWLGWLALALLVGIIALMLVHRSAWNQYQRIQNGMTEVEVLDLLGPPGEHRRQPGFIILGPRTIPVDQHVLENRGPFKLVVWYFNDGIIEVVLDRDGLVVGKYWHDEPQPDSWLVRLRRWLGW